MKKQTAGRDALGEIAPEFAKLNDDVLFGEVWSRTDKLPLKERSIVTVTCLISKGLITDALKYHLQTAKANGVSKTEMVEILTQLAFYAGWPNVWAAFPYVKEVYKDETVHPSDSLFGLGPENVAYSQYFTGKSYLKLLNKETGLANVTFEPGCRNYYHIHHVGGQILLCTDGVGIYQEEGKEPRKLLPGDVVYIPPETKHFHGALDNSWFTHVAFGEMKPGATTTWCEEVPDTLYHSLCDKIR
ncbi:MAG: carboxymuconolactone decarboxylase family protein [Bacilli bacterium]|jgi:4-carboxymuconolactone decarboxylase|nr:carboxymuconolactone decarboxylase family protein [Bacilli bacterium]